MSETEKNAIVPREYPMEGYGATTPNGSDRALLVDEDEKNRSKAGGRKPPPSGVHTVNSTGCVISNECFFRDGKRQIDFMLVYEETYDEKVLREQLHATDEPDIADPTTGDLDPEQEAAAQKAKTSSELLKKVNYRKKFQTNLVKTGLELEKETTELDKKTIHYLKLHAPWDVLCYYAEDMSLRAPLQAHPNPASNWSAKILETIKVPNMMADDVPNQPFDYYTCQFRKSKLSRFLAGDDTVGFFQVKDRHCILLEILASTTYGKKRRAEVGIERLLEEEVYSAAYPLHDGPFELPADYDETDGPPLNGRQVLYEFWARWGRWYKYQPLDNIRDYFGEKIGIYFAWLGFYTAWLLPAAVVGLFVFLYGVVTMKSNSVAKQTCESEDAFKMCPRCDENIGCAYWFLSDVCIYTTISYLFDHPGTVFYAVFVSFWAVTFLEYWKRKTASLAHHWDCTDFQDEEERPRPEYVSKCSHLEKNPITGIKEPHFPKQDRFPRILSGAAVIVMMMVLVIIFIIAVILYRVLVSIPLFQNEVLRAQATVIASGSAAVVNLILIMALGKVYEKLALKLTQWEMHRTQSDFEDQLIFKVFIFQFVNFYSSIIYIGFFKGKFVGYPGNYTHFLGLRSEECQNGGCLIELAQQLAVIMVGKQVIGNAQELLIPKMKGWYQRWKMGTRKDERPKERWEEDYELVENEGLFEEYLEMVLQFGFITIFVAAFPLAPLFALLNNWLEIRLDAHKFICETRRSVAERAQNIGVWFIILEALAQLAVISNAFLIAFTSEFLPKLLYQYHYNWDLNGYVNFTLAWAPGGTLSQPCRYQDFRNPDGSRSMFYYELLAVRLAFVIIFEHVVFGMNKVIDVLVPDVPESLEIKIKRERYLAKQALADTDTIMAIASREDEDDGDGGREAKINMDDDD